MIASPSRTNRPDQAALRNIQLPSKWISPW
jgi:hypothetical protein